MVSPSDSVSETSLGVDNGFFSNSISVTTSLAFGWFPWIFNGSWCQEWAAVDKFCLFFFFLPKDPWVGPGRLGETLQLCKTPPSHLPPFLIMDTLVGGG